MRHPLSTKSQQSDSGSLPKCSTCVRPLAFNAEASPATDSMADVASHIRELQKEWAKTPATRSKIHIKLLMQQTREYRLSQLQDHPNSGIKLSVTEFLYLEDEKNV